MCLLSWVQLFEIPQTVVHQAPLSMGFPSQEYWSGLPFPSPKALPDPGMMFPALQGGSLPPEPSGKTQHGLRTEKEVIEKEQKYPLKPGQSEEEALAFNGLYARNIWYPCVHECLVAQSCLTL